MRETIEFRIPEEHAQQHLAADIGESRGEIVKSVRRVRVATNEPLFKRICDLDRKFQLDSKGENFFFLGWFIHREYSKAELNSAEALQLNIRRTFEPAGEECGTVYDESTGCDICGSGAAQISDLVLDPRSLPRSVNLAIARTIAGEIIVSEPFVELNTTEALTGAIFRPVLRQGKQTTIVQGWRQLFGTSGAVNIVAPTKTGVRPTDEDVEGRFRCPLGHTIGLNILSELSVSRKDFEKSGCDIVFTKQRVGTRRGLLRPEPKIVISPRMWHALDESHLKGFGVQVVHLDEEKVSGTEKP